MAKKKEKTLEEKLQEALVPENQWPYILPENWCWTYVEFISDKIKRGKSPKYVEKSLFPVFAQKCNQKDGTIALEKARFLNPDMVSKISDDVFLREDDIVINSTGTGTLGRVGFIRKKDMLGYKQILPDSHVTTVRGVFCVNKLYLYMFLKMKQAYLELQGSGSTNQKELRPDSIGTIEFPLPPLLEQKRIVHRIESLFAKLDEAKEKIQQVLDGAEMRKAAILHKAFTGELTKNWRKENTAIFGNSSLGIDEELISDNLKKLPDNWCWCKIGDFLELKAGKNIKAENISIEKNDNNKYACYGGNGIRGYVDSFNVERTHIIIGRQGALCGNINIAENKFYATEHAVVVYPRYDTDISWLSENLRFLNLNQYSRSAAQPGLAVKNINNVLMPIAPYAEQVEMGRLISQMLNVWKQKEIICNKVLNKIDTMKKSILAKAFRGELGTNNPTEDSALNLLKEVLQDIS